MREEGHHAGHGDNILSPTATVAHSQVDSAPNRLVGLIEQAKANEIHPKQVKSDLVGQQAFMPTHFLPLA